MRVPLIALLTDFGTQDTYVGVMKGVIARIAPEVKVIDLTHGIPAGDIRQAAFKLWQSTPYFPSGTVFLSIVDPGVGTQRQPVVIAWPEFICVGPDNGLFTFLLATPDPLSVRLLDSPAHRLATTSSTFHGRDIFAPAAAHIALGEPLDKLGPPVRDLVRFPLPRLELLEGPVLRGEILHADQFGNLITSLGRLSVEANDLIFEPWLPGCLSSLLSAAQLCLHLPNGRIINLKTTFGDVPVGETLAYIGSDGMIEIAINRGRAADVLQLSRGQEVTLAYQQRTNP